MSEIFMTHGGIAVRDLEASRRFYVDTFGFEETYRMEIPPGFAALLGLSEVAGETVILRLGDKRIELIEHRPTPGGTAEKPMNKLGFTHIAFNVPDIDEVATRVEHNGGTVRWEDRIDVQSDDELRRYIFCRDLDGNHLELIKGVARG